MLLDQELVYRGDRVTVEGADALVGCEAHGWVARVADQVPEGVIELGMRHAPTLTFVHDALPENARHLDEVLARAKALDEEAAARRVETYAGDADPYKTRDPDEADESL